MNPLIGAVDSDSLRMGNGETLLKPENSSLRNRPAATESDLQNFLLSNSTAHTHPESVRGTYNGETRDWLSPLGFRFYAFQCKSDRLWRILDRDLDLSVTKGFRRRTIAIRAFNRLCRQWLDRMKPQS